MHRWILRRSFMVWKSRDLPWWLPLKLFWCLRIRITFNGRLLSCWCWYLFCIWNDLWCWILLSTRFQSCWCSNTSGLLCCWNGSFIYEWFNTLPRWIILRFWVCCWNERMPSWSLLWRRYCILIWHSLQFWNYFTSWIISFICLCCVHWWWILSIRKYSAFNRWLILWRR